MILCAYHFKGRVSIKIGGYFFESNTKEIFFVFIFYSFYCTIKDLFSFVYKDDMVTDLFYLFHTMSTKKYRRSSLRQFEDFVFDQVTVYRIKTTERFIKNNKLRFMQNSSNKL